MAEMLGGITGSLQGSVQGVFHKGSQWLDMIMPPEKRAQLSAKLQKFATEKPQLASFLLSNLALSGPAIAIFVIFTITIAVFALVVALIVALLAAVLFIVVAAGFALIILFPTLFFTTFVATALWLWVWAAYYVLKWFNEKDVPGIHTGFTESAQESVGKFLGNGEDGQDGELDAIEGKQKPNGTQDEQNGSATASGQDADGKAEGQTAKRHPGHKAPAGSRGGVGDAGQHVQDATGQAQGAVNNVGKNVPGGSQATGAVGNVSKNVPGLS